MCQAQSILHHTQESSYIVKKNSAFTTSKCKMSNAFIGVPKCCKKRFKKTNEDTSQIQCLLWKALALPKQSPKVPECMKKRKHGSETKFTNMKISCEIIILVYWNHYRYGNFGSSAPDLSSGAHKKEGHLCVQRLETLWAAKISLKKHSFPVSLAQAKQNLQNIAI